MIKIFRCIGQEDSVLIKVSRHDSVVFRFKSPSEEKVSDYEMKLMNLDMERLGIPETSYEAVVKMNANEFAKIIRDIAQFSESVAISCSKQGIKFSGTGDLGTANIKLAQHFDHENEDQNVTIDLQEPVSLTFATR